MASKRQQRKRRRRVDGGAAPRPSEPASPPSPTSTDDAQRSQTRRGRGAKAPPQAPWGSFPLTELVVLLALVMLVLGFVVAPPRGAILLGTGLALGSLAGLELAIREHFAGYKSHTLLLGGAVGIPVVAAVYFLGPESLPVWVSLLAGVLAFGAAAWLAASTFRRRSGGELFKFRA